MPRIIATKPSEDVAMDKAGYFVIVPLADKGVINVEHYAYDNSLLRVIEATNARAMYAMINNNGWLTELTHAAYLGKELVKAELSLQHGFSMSKMGHSSIAERRLTQRRAVLKIIVSQFGDDMFAGGTCLSGRC